MTGSLEALAHAAGLATHWQDYRGADHSVAPDVLRTVLGALGLPASSEAEAEASLDRFDEQTRQVSFLCRAPGESIAVPDAGGAVRLTGEDETSRDLEVEQGAVRAPGEYGLYRLETRDRSMTIAVCPESCWQPRDCGLSRAFGLATQIYGLRGGSSGDFGDLGAVASLAEWAAPAGADFLLLSPLHALRGAAPGNYQPYAPSTRLALSGLFADLSPLGITNADLGEDTLIDWQRAGPAKYAALRGAFARLRQNGGDLWSDCQAFIRNAPRRLLDHARFEVFDERFSRRGIHDPRQWPASCANADAPEARALSPDEPELAFHLFVQWIARRSLHEAQRRARRAGMGIGLIADLAIGMNSGGSHAWARPGDVLKGLTIGAPPDLLGPDGQNWGLTALSPHALRREGYRPFIETLRAALDGVGGLRIDHAMSLQRLWVIPEGGSASDGTYLAYPMPDLLRLIALESHRHKAIIIGEDLGTVPPGFREALASSGILGMRVLWFEQVEHGAFTDSASWPAASLAMTTTHDLPTLAGWWSGRDLAWRDRIKGRRDAAARRARTAEKKALLHALGEERSASPRRRSEFVDRAIDFVGRAGSDLAVVPVEDLLGLAEQPNLPGTIDEHPNWRRRLPPLTPPNAAKMKRRLARLAAARRRP